MASFRKPGPFGVNDNAIPPHAGTLARFLSVPPGTIGGDSYMFSHAAVAGRPAIGVAGTIATASGARAEADTGGDLRSVEQEAIKTLLNKSDEFTFQGRTYRLISAANWRELDGAERYQIVRLDEARAVVEAMLQKLPLSRTQRIAFQTVLELLEDLAPGSPNSGALLLHRAPSRYIRPTSAAPAFTPSQLKALRGTHWITIRLVDTAGNSIAGEAYVVTAPDNSEHTGTTDESGTGHLEGIIAGQCKISFPNLDRDVWS